MAEPISKDYKYLSRNSLSEFSNLLKSKEISSYPVINVK